MERKSVFLIFPHQLFRDADLLRNSDEVYLVEEHLFFHQYRFHKQKLVLHRASMRYYADYLRRQGLKLHYQDAGDGLCDIRKLIDQLAGEQVGSIHFYDVCDDWLEKRILISCRKYGIHPHEHPTPLFLNSKEDLKEYFEGRRKYFQTDFYILQRRKWDILLERDQKPAGGKWSYDAENRLKYPKDRIPPRVDFPEMNEFYREAVEYVHRHFGANPGTVSNRFIYPTTHRESESWLQQFLEQRFDDFGVYEDAIVGSESILHHSVLSPLLNTGLLLPGQVVQAAVEYGKEKDIPLNSLEGFIRQIIGWREFIRGVYLHRGVQERTTNFWKFHRPVPESFYKGRTGLKPLDGVIHKVMETGYCHHIERLMILGNFLLLSETGPDEVYRWFMEMFVDAYDWVMVPNVYGMSQFADGGLMATKPYISGSSYILKMSHYAKGGWCDVWDALFWTFMDRHRDFFTGNPRLGMLIKTYDKMSEDRKKKFQKITSEFIAAFMNSPV